MAISINYSNGNLVIYNTNANKLQNYILFGSLRYFVQPYFMQNFNNSSLRHLRQDRLLFAYGSVPLMSTYLRNCQLDTRSLILTLKLSLSRFSLFENQVILHGHRFANIC